MKDYPFNSEKMCDEFLDLFNNLLKIFKSIYKTKSYIVSVSIKK